MARFEFEILRQIQIVTTIVVTAKTEEEAEQKVEKKIEEGIADKGFKIILPKGWEIGDDETSCQPC